MRSAVSRLLATVRRGIYFWVLAHVEGRPEADDIDPTWERHAGLIRATHERPDTTGTTEGAETT